MAVQVRFASLQVTKVSQFTMIPQLSNVFKFGVAAGIILYLHARSTSRRRQTLQQFCDVVPPVADPPCRSTWTRGASAMNRPEQHAACFTSRRRPSFQQRCDVVPPRPLAHNQQVPDCPTFTRGKKGMSRPLHAATTLHKP